MGGGRYSFPFIFELNSSLYLLPEQNPSGLKLYELNKKDLTIFNSISLSHYIYTHDQIVISTPSGYKLIYANEQRQLISNSIVIKDDQIYIDSQKILMQKTILDRFRALLRRNYLTYRPAGQPIMSEEYIYLPVQAGRYGYYGEKIAIVRFNYELTYSKHKYINKINNNLKSHHVSYVFDNEFLYIAYDEANIKDNNWSISVKRYEL